MCRQRSSSRSRRTPTPPLLSFHAEVCAIAAADGVSSASCSRPATRPKRSSHGALRKGVRGISVEHFPLVESRLLQPCYGSAKTSRREPTAVCCEGDGLDRRHTFNDLEHPDRVVRVDRYRIGERSAHTWFVLSELLGVADVRNYGGSWTEWETE